jgi:hypothetical protein
MLQDDDNVPFFAIERPDVAVQASRPSQYGVGHAEAYHQIWPTTSRAVGDYPREDAVPLK